jgi:UDP:flavonoid glycosyltransferase YjiC (YdhE family)
MRILLTTFEGGGHVPPALLVGRRLAQRGHQVLVLSDEANREQARAAGLDFETWRRAPNRRQLGSADDPLDEWKARWPPAIVRRLCESVMTGPSAAYAKDVLEVAGAFRPNLIVTNELLFGVMAAAQSRDMPLAILTANVWCFPTRTDLPPFGPGFLASPERWATTRDEKVRALIGRWYDTGLQDLNDCRRELGLAPLARTLDQLAAARLTLLGVSRAFDFGTSPPPGFAYAGPLNEAPSWVGNESVEHLISRQQPNVLVSFSTTGQGQEQLLRRVVRAFEGLGAHAIVTLGPALEGLNLAAADNVCVVAKASHDALMPHCAAVVTHGGHGTVVRPLTHGKPVLCLPTGRDQFDNAARVVTAAQ